MRIALIILFFLNTCLISYSQEKIELKKADKLTGKTEGTETIREVSGNVNFIQGNIIVYCNTATQFVEANRVELRGNVRIYQDAVSLFTEKATYFGNDQKAICENGVTLKDPNATLRADYGVYTFSDYKAHFKGDVIIVNPTYKITSKELIYYRNTEDSYCSGNVKVVTDSMVIKSEYLNFYRRQGKTFAWENVSIEKDSGIIYSDTLTNYSFEKKSIASGNVRLYSYKDNMAVAGDYLENYDLTYYTLISGNAELIRPDNNSDTLFIFSNTIESYRSPPQHYIAKDSVNILKGQFLSKCGKAIFYVKTDSTKDDVILENNPVVWQDNMQLTADSIHAEIRNKKIENLFARKLSVLPKTKFSFLIVENFSIDFRDRYDQIKGNHITILFSNNKIERVLVDTNSNGIYYSWEDKKANGINIIQGQNMVIYFDTAQKVIKLRVDKDPVGEYVPENLINSVERFLPDFIVRTDKPEKEKLRRRL